MYEKKMDLFRNLSVVIAVIDTAVLYPVLVSSAGILHITVVNC